MNHVPNWFRWLVIIIATLILSACQAPLQHEDLATLPITANRRLGVRETLQSIQTQASKASISASESSELAPVVRETHAGTQSQATRAKHTITEPAKPKRDTHALSLLAEQLQKASDGESHSQAPLSMPVQEISDGKAVELVAAEPQSENQRDESTLAGIEGPPAEMEQVPVQPPVVVASQHTAADATGEVLAANAEEPVFPEPTQAEPEWVEADCLPAYEMPIDTATGVVEAYDSLVRVPGSDELVRRYPDEYICDGGDQFGRVTVAVDDWSVKNLDPEDTVAHFDTLDNRVIVEPSNRVCIYAPRFAATRKVTAPFQNEAREQVLLAERGTKPIINDGRQVAEQSSQTTAPRRHLLILPPSSLTSRQPSVTGIHRQALMKLEHELSVHEDFRVIQFGTHKQSEMASLVEFAAKAVTWSHDKAVQVIVDEIFLQTRVSRRAAETFFAVGDNGPAKLRVIKTASTADALPGEEVEFTLRFDNVGFQPIGNVTIIDNLTTRLEFIDESDDCTLQSEFSTDDNRAESLTLRWEITDPIEPGEGGQIQFRCRVR